MTAKTYNFKSAISNLREITAGRGTFAVGKLVREGKRDIYLKITDSALSKARAAGLDLTGPVDLFGRFEAKPFTTTAGVQKTAQTFVVLSINPIRTPEEIAQLVAERAEAQRLIEEAQALEEKAEARRAKRRVQAANRRAAKKLAEAIPA